MKSFLSRLAAKVMVPIMMGPVMIVGLSLAGYVDRAAAVDKSRVPPVTVYQAMLKANKPTGWVQFRRFNGQQLVYFTPLQTMHCRLNEIRYSINSRDLDKRFALVPCNPLMPFSLPTDTKLKDVLIKLPIGAARYVAVQVVWEDGQTSDVAVYEPCKNVGDATCAFELKEVEPDSQSGRALAPEAPADGAAEEDAAPPDVGNQRGAPMATPSPR